MVLFYLQPEFDLSNPLLTKERIQFLPDIALQEGQLLKPDGVGHADAKATFADPGRICSPRYGRPDGIAPHAPDAAILTTERQVPPREKARDDLPERAHGLTVRCHGLSLPWLIQKSRPLPLERKCGRF
jgi:hypothetical protein